MSRMQLSQLSKAVWLVCGAAGAMVSAPALGQERVQITGSRILKADFQAASPTVTVPLLEIVGRQDVTLDTVLNALPQVNPAGTTTSNNPGNGGQANVDLRGLGSNRNLVLIDGRRPMVSASDQTVDLNTIPLALIESIEVITGGAGAVYGADAVAGVVNVKLRKRFQGLTVALGTSNSTEKRDAREDRFSVVGGGNFEGNTGGGAIYIDYSKRQALIKSQRDFAATATATTSFFPEGSYRPGGNQPSQAAIDTLFGQTTYRQPFVPGQATTGGLLNYTAGGADIARSSAFTFNSDGSLISVGVFNNPRDVRNWRYPVDTGVNSRIFPDAYSYNFDAVNILVLPVERWSIGTKVDFTMPSGVEIFGRGSLTTYSAKSALAPTPTPTVDVGATSTATATQARSTLVVAGRTTGNQLVVPVTNPFVSADLKALLASRTGDAAQLIGSGATEPFFMRWRTLGIGLRESVYNNDVTQAVIGAKGDLFSSNWSWEASGSYGKTTIRQQQLGNVDTQRLQSAFEAPDGGASVCSGGINPFGRQALSASCAQYLSVETGLTRVFTQKIAQGFVTGDIATLPAGGLTAVAGAEWRDFGYLLDPGSASGPISGFNVQSKASGKNQFTDLFGELQIPLARKAAFAQSLDLSLAARTSQSQFDDVQNQVKGDKRRSNTFAVNLTWQPATELRARGSLQRSVRAPNFTELFDGGGSAPQYFDPCSATSLGRTTGSNAAKLSSLCAVVDSAGVPLPSTYVQTPGTQASINVAGNTALKPETGTSATLGLVFVAGTNSPARGFSASVDYYQIQIKDAITVPDTNEIIADCYNYYGRNPAYSATYSSCQGILRGGGDIARVDDPSTASGAFAGTNGGKIKTSGVDLAFGFRSSAGPGEMNIGLNVTHLLSYKARSASYLPEKEFAGTIPYFGAGFGQAFPKTRLALTGGYTWGIFGIDARYRYFAAMSNRMSLNFPGETFTGTAATGYFDLGVSVEVLKALTFRVGLNNATDQKPRTYAPNVQSGTDPSTFDVIGRRAFVQATAKF